MSVGVLDSANNNNCLSTWRQNYAEQSTCEYSGFACASILLRKDWVVLGRYKAEIRCKLNNTLIHFCAAKLHSSEHMYIQSHDPLEQTRHVMRGYRHYNIPNNLKFLF